MFNAVFCCNHYIGVIALNCIACSVCVHLFINIPNENITLFGLTLENVILVTVIAENIHYLNNRLNHNTINTVVQTRYMYALSDER